MIWLFVFLALATCAITLALDKLGAIRTATADFGYVLSVCYAATAVLYGVIYLIYYL